MKAKFRLESGLNEGTEVALRADRPTVIGRSPHADVTVPDVHVSKSHCHVVFAARQWTITDLNSSNGTFVNDRQIKTLALSDGDVVRVGKTMLRFTLEPEPEAAAPSPPTPAANGESGLFRLLARAEQESSPTASAAQPESQAAAETPVSPPPATPAPETPAPAPPATPDPAKADAAPEQETGELFSLIKNKLRRGEK